MPFESAVTSSYNESLTLPNGGALRVEKFERVTLNSVSNEGACIVLTDVHFAPKLSNNPISLGCLRKKGFVLKDNGTKCR